MILSVSEQSRLFLMTVVMGGGLGFLYDLFRIWRKLWKHSNFMVHVEDVLYWVLVSLLMFYFLLSESYGEIRFFSLLGAFIGMALYFLLLSPFVLKILLTIITFMGNAIKRAIALLMWPLRVALNIVTIPLWYSLKKLLWFKKILQKVYRYAKMRKTRAVKDIEVIFKKV